MIYEMIEIQVILDSDLEYNFYLINDNELLKLDTTEHTYDKTVYSE